MRSVNRVIIPFNADICMRESYFNFARHIVDYSYKPLLSGKSPGKLAQA